MSQPLTAANFQVVFGPVPKPFPSELWKNRASIFLMDDANPEEIGCDGKPLSEVLTENFVRPQEILTYRVSGLQLGPVLYDIPADSGMFISIRLNASNPALSVCEVFLDNTEGIKPRFGSWHLSLKKLGRIELSWVRLMAAFISSKIEIEVPKDEKQKFEAAHRMIHDHLNVSPMQTPLWSFITIMALVIATKNETHKEDVLLQSVAYVCTAYDRHLQVIHQKNPTESSPAPSAVLENKHGDAYKLDESPVPEGILLC